MGLSDELQEGVGPLWERVVTHPFVIELGDGTLPQEIFDVYFEQDYLFVKELGILRSLAKAKAPDYADAAGHFGLGGEGAHFQQSFQERGLSSQDVANLEYRPATLHYSSYLRKMSYEGGFIDLITTWLAVEWPYLEWAQRLVAAGKRPDNYFYQIWIDNHTNQHMIDFVGWLRHTVDTTPVTQADGLRLRRIFRDVLRYEFLFWEMAYRDDQWPEG